MHLHSVEIEGIRSIASLKWELTNRKDFAGWHVVLGDNGAGKSTFLRSIALSLVGTTEALALRQDWGTWLRHGVDRGEVRTWFNPGESDRFVERGKQPKKFYCEAGVEFRRNADGVVQLARPSFQHDPDRSVWGTGAGWFSASYGPFRRFGGGDKDLEKLFYSHSKLARHLSVFGESVALSECLEWLRLLRFKKLEHDAEGELLEPIQRFVNESGFLPHGTKLHEVTSKGVRFVDGNGLDIDVENLSDGFRSILSMTFELIRQLAKTYGAQGVFAPGDPTRVIASGVVLIDEVDAHLHPTWQRRIGRWFTTHFPNIQFIVTTHSPLVCQAAEAGSVFRLARPGSNDPSSMIDGQELQRLLFGNVLDAYASGAFGTMGDRSEAAQERLARLALLNQKDLHAGLTDDETREQHELRAVFPTQAAVLPPEAPGAPS